MGQYIYTYIYIYVSFREAVYYIDIYSLCRSLSLGFLACVANSPFSASIHIVTLNVSFYSISPSYVSVPNLYISLFRPFALWFDDFNECQFAETSYSRESSSCFRYYYYRGKKKSSQEDTSSHSRLVRPLPPKTEMRTIPPQIYSFTALMSSPLSWSESIIFMRT